MDAAWNGVYYTNMLKTAVLLPATDGGQGNAATNLNYLTYSVIPFLNNLQALGVNTIKCSMNYPSLYQPYYDSTNGVNNPAGYTNMLNFFSNVVHQVRLRGMKMIIPSQNIRSGAL